MAERRSYLLGENVKKEPFLKLPWFLLEDDELKMLSSDAKLLYTIMQNRAILSKKNKWVDEYDRIYIYMPLKEIEQLINCTEKTASNVINSLKKVGLIEVKRQGLGKPNKIYVKDMLLIKNDESRNGKITGQETEKLQGSNNNISNKDISNKDLVIKSNYINIITMYNDTCVSLPRVRRLSTRREKAIKARLNKYSIDDFKELFELAEASEFLKGGNDRNWIADFDWLIKDDNFIKVLEGKYKNKYIKNDNKGGDDKKVTSNISAFAKYAQPIKTSKELKELEEIARREGIDIK